jgi:hypothetical protein
MTQSEESGIAPAFKDSRIRPSIAQYKTKEAGILGFSTRLDLIRL